MVSRHVVTLANSIVGVSVLAMPFCFKQCGIVLATLSLMMGAVMTRMVCYFLLKAAVMNRRRTYEMLAWSTFGQTGKFMVEISIIGFLIGTLIAFMVVIGDLGPEILSEIFSVENNSSLRTIIMTALSLFVSLPLGLLRNIDSLSSVSTASVLFYLFLMIKIFIDGIGPLWSGEYLERIHFWRSGGVLQCIPIFSMALSCQTQIFGIYDALPEPSLQTMNEIVKRAVNICTFFYFSVGFFGYIAFSHQNFGGNILLSFTPTWSTQLIKSMFLMSVVFSVPLVVFPCRASLHSLIFKSAGSYHHVHDMSTNYIPEARMKFLTVTIVGFALVVGILIPNIEVVLGLVGSTTGSVICIIFPSIMFVRVTSKNTTERLLSQIIFVIGIVLMVLCTYTNLEKSQAQMNDNVPDHLRVTEKLLLLNPVGVRQDSVQLNSPISKLDEGKQLMSHAEFEQKVSNRMSSDNRRTPGPRKETHGVEINIKKEKLKEIPRNNPQPPSPEILDIQKIEKQKVADINRESEKTEDDLRIKETQVNVDRKNEVGKESISEQKPRTNFEPDVKLPSKISPSKLDVGGDQKKEFVEKAAAEDFLKRLEEHQENQKKLLEEQKEILEELKQHHAHDVREKIEKEKQKDSTPEKVVVIEGKQSPQTGKFKSINEPIPSLKDVGGSEADIIKQQEKIIETISENIDKENKNVQLLEKFEEGLNKEVKLKDAVGISQKMPKTNEDDDSLKRKKDHAIPSQLNLDSQKQKSKDAINLLDAKADTGSQAGKLIDNIPSEQELEHGKAIKLNEPIGIAKLSEDQAKPVNRGDVKKQNPPIDADKKDGIKKAEPLVETANKKNENIVQKMPDVSSKSPASSSKGLPENAPKENVDREI